MRAIVLAGGLGTRLARVTGDIPKPMAPIGSRPFLEYLLGYLVEQGSEGVILAVSHKWEVIREHFADDYRGMPLNYSVEDEPLGTGGAIRQALESLPDDEVLVLNVEGYIGESTANEIAYAEKTGKPVQYLEPVSAAVG